VPVVRATQIRSTRSLAVTRTAGTILFVALLALASASCGSGPKLHPVTGKVFAGDRPAEGANVVLHPVNASADSPRPSGIVADDGAFTLHTHPHGPGAPPGEYVVVVTWYPPNARESANPKSKFPEIYGDSTRSPLRATVRDGPTELEPIKLPAPKK
jgi:hypothetical protein